MPTPPTTQNYNVTIERRVENLCRAAMLLTDGLTVDLVRIVVRDEDSALLQNDDSPLPIIKLEAKDQGRVRLTPFRDILLNLTARSTKEKASSAAFLIVCANLEEWLDNTNLKTQLTDATTGVYTFVAVRQPGTNVTMENNIRSQTYSISLKAVPKERTTT